jgi:hypothetical protein
MFSSVFLLFLNALIGGRLAGLASAEAYAQKQEGEKYVF